MIDSAELLKRVRSLPAFPANVAEFDAVLASERSTPAEIAEVLRRDPALVANVLRLVNSAAFGLNRRIDSIEQAVGIVGRGRLRELIAGDSLARILPPELPGIGLDAAGFWLHSVAVAELAKRIAERRRAAPEAAYLAGLLHDVGKLAIGAFLARVEEQFVHALRDAHLVELDAERSLLGTDHAAVGGTLTAHWKLPESVTHAATWHHEPSAPGAQDAFGVADTVHLADGLAHSLGFGADRAELARRADGGALARLGLGVKDLEETASDAIVPIGRMARLFVEGRG
jgi:putative nucleotidyltransferase with HDIG domain